MRTENLARIREQLGVPPVEIPYEEVEEADEPPADGVLSVFVQDSPEKPHDATPLRILDFHIDRK